MHTLHQFRQAQIHVAVPPGIEYENGKQQQQQQRAKKWMNLEEQQKNGGGDLLLPRPELSTNGVMTAHIGQQPPPQSPPQIQQQKAQHGGDGIEPAMNGQPAVDGAAPEDNVQLVQTAFEAMALGTNFNRLVKGIRILSATAPTIRAELTVAQDKANDKATMHGGCTAALVDILTATSVRLLVPDSPIVSIDLSISYLAPAKLGETIVMEASCLKAGRSVAFTEACFRRRADQTVLIKARQQLAILSSPQPHPQQAQPKTVPTDVPPLHNNTTTKPLEAVQNGQAAEATTKEANKARNSATGATPPTDHNLVHYESGGSHFEQMRQHFEEMGNKSNYYQIAKNLEVVHAGPPILAVRITLAEQHLNNGGTMHGGFTASLVDIVTSRAVSMTDTCPRSSLDLSISYLLPAKLGDTIVVQGRCLKIGRMMAFTEAEFRRQRDGALVAKGRHNMFMLRHIQQQQKKKMGTATAEEEGPVENGTTTGGGNGGY